MQVLVAYSPTIPSPSRSSIYLYSQSYIKVIGIHCLILKEPHIIDISKMCDLILIFFSTNAPVVEVHCFTNLSLAISFNI